MDSSLYQTLFILALIGCPFAYYSWKTFLKQSIPIGIIFSLVLVLISFLVMKVNTIESLMYSVSFVCISLGFLVTIIVLSIPKAIGDYKQQKELLRLHQEEQILMIKEFEHKS